MFIVIMCKVFININKKECVALVTLIACHERSLRKKYLWNVAERYERNDIKEEMISGWFVRCISSTTTCYLTLAFLVMRA